MFEVESTLLELSQPTNRITVSCSFKSERAHLVDWGRLSTARDEILYVEWHLSTKSVGMDSNHRRPRSADLQSAAIAAMRPTEGGAVNLYTTR